MKKITSSNLPIPIDEPDCHRPTRPANADPLDPPYVNDPVKPISGADLGLGIRHTAPWMIVNFEKWFNFEVGDTFKLFMGGTSFAIASDEVRPDDLYKDRVQLVIPKELIPEGNIYPCFGEVLRVGSGTPSISAYQTWFIKTTRPGGVSNNPYYHSRLVIHLPPDLVGGVLDPERAAQGVDLTIDPYPNMTEEDTIEVWWNGYPVFLQIDRDHLDGFKPIVVHVSESTILAGGSGLIKIFFRVFDRVFNFSGEIPQWSKALSLDSDLDPFLLERPHLIVDGISVDEINFDTDGEKAFEAEVYVPRRLPNGVTTPTGALIVMTLTLFDAEGGTTSVNLPAFPARIGLSATTDIDNKLIQSVIGGHLQIDYKLTTAFGDLLGTSRRLSITVTGTQKTMPAMIIEQNESGYIDPDHPFIKAIFPPYIPYDSNYSVTFRMEAPRPGGGLVYYEETLFAGPPPPPDRFRIVTQEHFERFVGLGTVQVFYLVNDGMNRSMGAGIQTVRKSDVLEVTFGEAFADLQAPILQYVDPFENLDPDDIIGGQLKVTLPYSYTVPGDKFDWKWLGANSNGTTGGEITLNNATAGSPAEFLVDAAFVIANVNKEIRLSYSLIPANGGSPRYSERLTVTVGAVLSLLRPEVLEAHRYPDQLVPEAVLNGATIVVTFPQMLPSHRIRACWTGIPGIGTYCETQDGNTSKTVHFHVDPEVIGANLQPYGHFIDVQYFVLLGVHEKASPILSLELLPAVLPQPYLEGHLNTGVLDISALTGTERAIVNIWHFIHRYQRMWFYLSGTYASGYPFSYTFYDGDLVTRDGEQTGVHTPAPVAELRQLLDGSQLIMSFGVAFDQSTVEANAVWFPERSYTVQAIPAEFPVPRLLQASGSGAAVTLKALDAQNGATIEVAFAPMYTTDTITVRC